jgi:hypothetical protein
MKNVALTEKALAESAPAFMSEYGTGTAYNN